MGILNVTPDSFSDGGKFDSTDSAVAQALKLQAEGADIIDIGGESTRPYSQAVTTEQELQRVIPVIEKLARQIEIPISIDTSKAQVAEQAIAAGAEIINDVTGLQGDPAMVSVAIESGAGVCAMHMQGTPQDMQDNPSYQDVVEEIFSYLKSRRTCLLDAGIKEENICLDPGIGFGKTHQHNLQLMNQVSRFLELGSPILVGHSRKGFIRKATGDESSERIAGTLAASLHLAAAGVHIIRVHDILETRQAIKMQQAIHSISIK